MMIREARPGDAATIAELATQLGYPSDAATIARRLGQVTGAVLVHVQDDHLIGWIHVAGWPQLTADATARILAFVVDERHRGQKIGAGLLRAAETWARDQGYVHVIVSSRMHRTRTHTFYERAGYEVAKEQKVFRKPLT